MPKNETLTHRVVKGGFWVFILRVVGQFLAFIRLIILARMLSPNDFGLMGIALLTLSILETFSQPGFHQALIQKKENIDSYLDSAWIILIIRGFMIAAIIYLIAPYASIFFKSPSAKPIIQIIGLSILIEAFTNIGVIYFQKELEFNKQFIYELTGTVANFIVAVSAVLILKNVWALVLGLLTANLIKCVVSYFIHPYRPHFTTDFTKAKQLWGFGKWVMGSNIVIFLITHGDDIFVGKFLGASALGLYQVAYRISNIPATEITHVISQVTFPAYSKLQDNIPKLREAYLRVLQFTTFLSFPIAGSLFVLAPDFTRIFLGEKWLPMVQTMQVLCIFAVARSIAATMGSVFYSVARPKIQTKLAIIQLTIMVIIIYPLTAQWNILGTSLAVFIPMFLILIIGAREIKNILAVENKEYFGIMGIRTGQVFLMLLSIVLTKKWLLFGENATNFLFQLLFGSLVYFVTTYLLDKFSVYKIKDIINEIKNTYRELITCIRPGTRNL